MRWCTVIEVLDRPEWYAAMYSLVAHRVHDGLETRDERARARCEALLLTLGCAANIRRRTSRARIRLDRYRWPPELEELDRKLFRYEGREPPPYPRREVHRVPWRYRVRRPSDTEHEFTRFLERIVEPSALILLAGIPPVASAGQAEPWSRAELIDELAEAARSAGKPDADKLIATARDREGLDGRAYYNLACYYSEAGDEELAREHLRAAVFAASGALRNARVRAARSDPTLQRALKGWREADEVLRLHKTVVPPSEPPELERVAAIGGYAEKLAERDIMTPETLAKRLASQETRSRLAKDLDVDIQLLDRWRGLLRLLEIDGIGPAQLNLLEAADILTPEKLGADSVENLHRRLVETNAARRLVRAVPSEATLTAWREEAAAAGA
jgi:predicted flap endonuclease-1-like 5' DNA nuclease